MKPETRVSDSKSRTDRALLREYSERGSHAAFAALVKRHGAMVHGVSLRVLSNHHDAEDVTQAVFLKLAREAGRLGGRSSVAGWLHTVSRRLSLNARQSRESRTRREQAAMNDAIHSTPDATPSAGFRRELDAALARLPNHYREPLVLFHLEGASLKEAARRLDLHPTTLRTRLSRGRDLLRQMLRRRGVEVTSVGLLGALLTAEAEAVVLSPGLAGRVLEVAAGGGAEIPTRVLELAGKAAGPQLSLPSLALLVKTKTTVVSAILFALAAIGTVAFFNRDAAGPATPEERRIAATAPAADRTKISVRRQVDPLSRISTREQFMALVDSVLLIEDEAERLAAIRRKLGMDLSEAAYRRAVAAHGYQVNPRGLFDRLLAAWSQEDPGGLTRWSARFAGEYRTELLRASLAAWLATDGTAAEIWVADQELEPELVAVSREIVEQQRKRPRLPESSAETTRLLRGMRDEIGALYAAGPQAREERTERMRRFCSLMEQWVERDAKAAVEFAFSLDSSTRNLLSENIDFQDFIKKWAHTDPDQALGWAKDVEHPDERIEALAAVLPSWQLKHPDQGIDQALDLDQIPARRYQHLIEGLVSDWAVHDPGAAVDYALRLEDPEFRDRVVSGVVESWVRKDPGEVLGWAATLPPGELRDSGLTIVGERVAMSDFGAAVQLVGRIESPAAKDHAIHRMMIGGKAIRHHFEDALRLADREMSELAFHELRTWAHEVRPEDIPAFREWLDNARDAGRIQWHSERQPKAIDPELGYRFILEGLRPEQE